jgi:hypothetical protein
MIFSITRSPALSRPVPIVLLGELTEDQRRYVDVCVNAIDGERARYRHHYQTGCIPPASAVDHLDPRREGAQLEELDELRQILDQNTADLSAVEQRVLGARFSLRLLGASSAVQPRTLDQVGTMLGVSKERVRQLQNQAICKIRTTLKQRIAAAS